MFPFDELTGPHGQGEGGGRARLCAQANRGARIRPDFCAVARIVEEEAGNFDDADDAKGGGLRGRLGDGAGSK
jgi:hypothetical protein